MTDQEMTPDKETLRCPFCGNNLEFDNGGDFISLICVTCNMELPLRMYENAYCWKELDSLRAENEKLKEENEGNQVWIGRLEKDLEEQCLLLGKSGSREAQLLTRIGELEEALKEVRNLSSLNKECTCEYDSSNCPHYYENKIETVVREALSKTPFDSQEKGNDRTNQRRK